MISHIIITTPIGNIIIVSDGEAIIACKPTPETATSAAKTPLLNNAATQLNDYFTGRLKNFNLPLKPLKNTTPFRLKVWKHLLKIPYGTTISYAELARRIGNPKATRAVAQACSKNPLPILIPCHRVISSDRTLGGYAYGFRIKQQLLQLEQAIL